MGRFTAGVAEVLRQTFAHEALPPPPCEPPRHLGPGRLSRLFAPDPLPPDLPPAAPPGRSWLAWLFSAERLEP